eukprot:756500-Hanusia_phi.AAC.3
MFELPSSESQSHRVAGRAAESELPSSSSCRAVAFRFVTGMVWAERDAKCQMKTTEKRNGEVNQTGPARICDVLMRGDQESR